MIGILCLIALSATARGQVLYVDDSAAGAADGSTWCDAMPVLQDALAAASASKGTITEIRVAQGTYKPDVGVGQIALSRGSTFRLINGVALRGGYAGCGTPNPDARDTTLFATTLSGDLLGNDVGDGPGPSRNDNAYHVVTGSGTDAMAVLDGLVITGGNANGAGSNADGGGLFNDGGSPTITNCRFTLNLATRRGGGILNWRSSSPEITNCQIDHNEADFGGGVSNITQSHPVITGCEVSQNESGDHGAGVYNDFASAPQLIDCTITDNSSFYDGGGVASYFQSNVTLTGCYVAGNRSRTATGGGMYSQSCSPVVSGCVFENNSASISGGGMSNFLALPSVSHTVFRGNRANNGGGMVNIDASASLHNCLFDRNESGLDGAGMYNFRTGTVAVRNSTIVNNVASRLGGGVFNDLNNPVLTNVIIWGNSDNQGTGESSQVRGGAPVVSHSCIQGWTGLLGGVGSQGLDPKFTSGPGGCFYLSQWDSGSSVQSPGVDAGSDQATAFELDSMTTRTDSTADSGVVDLGYHYTIVDAVCGAGNVTCHNRVNLRDFAQLQQCFGAGTSAAGVLCCEQFDVDGVPGLTLNDFETLAAALSDP